MKKIVSLLLVFIIVSGICCVNLSAQSADITLEECLYQGFKNCETKIDVSDFNILWENVEEELYPILVDFEHMHPEIFHLSGGFSVSRGNKNGKNYLISVNVTYTVSAEEYKQQLRRFNFWVSEIVNKIDKDATDLEKILFVHEFFAANFEYDYSYTIYDAYNFLKNKTGVCQAYTLAFTAVMQKLGIFCTSAIDIGDNHCWNVVKLGNNYYNIDVTHDDGKYILNGCEMSNHCDRNHLLLSDTTMKTLDQHRCGWYTVGGDFKCTDASYENKLWQDYKNPSVYVDGVWYQVFGGDFEQKGYDVFYTALLYKTDVQNNKTLFKIFYIPARNEGMYYYSCNYNIFAVGDVIFGGGGNYIWRYSFGKDEFETIYTTNENIFEISYIGGGKIKLAIDNGDGTYSFKQHKFTIGDSDDNGKLDVNDVVSLKKYLLFNTTDYNVGFMDLNGDCFVDVLDFIEITKAVV